jgi:hypothetical protein
MFNNMVNEVLDRGVLLAGKESRAFTELDAIVDRRWTSIKLWSCGLKWSDFVTEGMLVDIPFFLCICCGILNY